MALIFIWYLVTTPMDRIVCNLWVREIPDRNVLMQSCGFFDASGYRIDVVPAGGSKVACSRDGAALPTIEADCGLPLPLDQYTLRIVWPKYSELICSLNVEHEGQPTRGEIQDACGTDAQLRLDAQAVQLRFVRSEPKPPEEPPRICEAPQLLAGFGIYDQAPDAGNLWTDHDLAMLAGKLIWNGIVRPSCPGGYSGLDPVTLAPDGCGMSAARAAVIEWQNRYDAEIYAAAIAYRVPARLLKRIIEVESQFWPEWDNSAGEFGMLQISQNGADVLLRYDPDLDPSYGGRSAEEQYWRRMDVLRILACAHCGIWQAVDSMQQTIPIYARLLAAYRCRAVEMQPGLAGAAAWRQAASDYNGSDDYLRKVEG